MSAFFFLTLRAEEAAHFIKIALAGVGARMAKRTAERRCVPKDSRKANTNLFLYRLFSVVPPIWVVSKCALAGRLYKPPSEREGDRVSGGRSLRDLGFGITST